MVRCLSLLRSDKDYKSWDPSPASSVLLGLAGGVKDPTHSLQRVGHVALGAVLLPCLAG